ncbi:hypothetical protein BGZ76_003298, partial [Entomortierella beljakovae]
FVIPGVIIALAIVFLLFGTKYGFRGTKRDKLEQKIAEAAQKHTTSSSKDQLSNLIIEALKKYEKVPADLPKDNQILADNPEGQVDQENPVNPDKAAEEEL